MTTAIEDAGAAVAMLAFIFAGTLWLGHRWNQLEKAKWRRDRAAARFRAFAPDCIDNDTDLP